MKSDFFIISLVVNEYNISRSFTRIVRVVRSEPSLPNCKAPFVLVTSALDLVRVPWNTVQPRGALTIDFLDSCFSQPG